VATVVAGSGNAEWRVHLLWVLREQYIVAWLAPDYGAVIVGRNARDYMWLMARTPQIPAGEYRRLLERVKAMGYDLSKVRKSPQRWPEAGAAPSFGGALPRTHPAQVKDGISERTSSNAPSVVVMSG
jgi:apolipoprotein D and lipocalin family protein